MPYAWTNQCPKRIIKFRVLVIEEINSAGADCSDLIEKCDADVIIDIIITM